MSMAPIMKEQKETNLKTVSKKESQNGRKKWAVKNVVKSAWTAHGNVFTFSIYIGRLFPISFLQ